MLANVDWSKLRIETIAGHQAQKKRIGAATINKLYL